jgi:hypothetical protein
MEGRTKKLTNRIQGGTETKQIEWKEGQKPIKENGSKDRNQTKRMEGGRVPTKRTDRRRIL